ncbi:MAG: hypothetical protein AB1798_08015 [Spirochaetota bacterium]
MSDETTLHIKIKRRVAGNLKELARQQGQSVGELVRKAITAAYQPDLMDIPVDQRRAIEAYQGGYISLGKLSEIMGMHALKLRIWLEQRSIPENTSYGLEDVQNA